MSSAHSQLVWLNAFYCNTAPKKVHSFSNIDDTINLECQAYVDTSY